MNNEFNWKELQGKSLLINYAEDIDWQGENGVKVETAIGFDKVSGKYYVLHVKKEILKQEETA